MRRVHFVFWVLVLSLFFLSPTSAQSGHAPRIWYNVPNYYNTPDILNHRFRDAGSAFSVDWDKYNPKCANGNPQYVLLNVYMEHVDGYEDGDLYGASLDAYDYSTCSSATYWPQYQSGARRYAVCDIRWTPYNVDAYPGGTCGAPAPDLEKNKGHTKCPCDAKGDPVNPSTGNKFEQLTVYRGSGAFPLEFVIAYNSFLGETASLSATELFVGARRVHNYMRKIDVEAVPAVTTAYVVRPDGKTLAFNQSGTLWVGDPDVSDQLIATYSGSTVTSWLYQAADGSQENYDGTGKLLSIVQRGGLTQTFAYDSSNRLQTVTDPNGRILSFAYDTSGRLNQVTDPAGNIYQFAYDSYNNLETVTYPDLTTSGFTYWENTNSGDAATEWDLTGVTDENGKRVDTTHYDANDQVYSVVGAVGANPFTFSYTSQPDGSITYAYEEPLGETDSVTTQYLYGIPRPLVRSRSCSGCTTTTSEYLYDVAGYVISSTDFNGLTTCSAYDDASGLETSRTEGVASNPSCTSPIHGVRTIQTDWNVAFRVPNERRVLNGNGVLEQKIDWVYNTRGQALAKCETDPADTSGYVCSATTAPGSTAKVRRWSFTYCDTVGTGCPLIGLLKTQDGPRIDVSDVTTFAYYQTSDTSGCTTQGGTCHYMGDLQTTTNALGQVTTYVSYDKDGRPTRIKDVNSTLTDMTYHARGWLLTRTVRYNASGSTSGNDATTTFAYDSVGNVKQVTQPDGSYLAYTYDDAHRLTDVQDNLGNKLHYTLDAAGNRTLEQTYDPSSNLKRALARQFDQLNRLTETLNAASVAVQTYTNPAEGPPSGVTYTDGYDGNGNAIYSVDGTSGHVGTEQQYDPLNRLTKILQDHAGTGSTHDTTTQYAYDTRDNLRSVIDADNLTTSYTYDGLNNLTALGSPDTGNTGYTYDAAGNRLTQTDARNVQTTYTYDSLNRLTGVTYPTTTLNVAYAYDQSNATTGCSTSYPIGRLTRITDNSGTTTYCYDRRGNVMQRKQVTNGVALTTTYTYTLADRIATISYPSTAVVTYTRNSIGQITKITYKPTPTGTVSTLVKAATYYPYGPLNVLTFGNGRTLTKTYDQDYAIDKVVSSVSSGLLIDATVDVLGNLANASSTVGASPPTQKYQYDPLYRLTAVQNGSGTAMLSFAYEATGDRTTKTPQGQSAQSYSYAPGTHHLTSVAGVTRSIDANGNTTTLNGTTITYDNRNRLTAAGAETYNYNGKGERVSKSSPATLFTYSENGSLLGEYSNTGAVQREYIAMDGALVGAAAGSQIYYVETDQLGSPRQVIQPGSSPANDVQVWKWDYFANGSVFGENAPSPQTITLNLRFPGHYYDAETGLNYNYFRDYEPGTGRYVESDPIGLEGGSSTYAYVSSDPLSSYDPTGEQAAAALSGFAGEAGAGASMCLPCAGAALGGAAVGTWISNTYGAAIVDFMVRTVKGKWTCTASCNVQQIDPNACCPPRVSGIGYGSNQNEACRNAKRDATTSTPRGCYGRHCQCSTCWKN